MNNSKRAGKNKQNIINSHTDVSSAELQNHIISLSTGVKYVIAPKIGWVKMILVLIQLLFTYMPVMQNLFGTTAIDISAWVRIVAFGILLFAAVEIEKYLIRKIRKKN